MRSGDSRILVAIRNDGYTQTLQAQLRTQGYTVHWVGDAEEGVRLAKQWLPDLIIADDALSTKDGVPFYRCVREIRELKTTYFILLSAQIAIESKIRALEAGIDAFLPKLGDTRELLAYVRVGLRTCRYRREAEELKSSHALNTLAVTLAHEINNPLTGIIGYLAFLEEATREMHRTDLEHMVRKIQGQAERIHDVIGRLQDLQEVRWTNYLDGVPMLDLYPRVNHE